MTGIVHWFVDTASALLPPEDRDAVRGDLTELHVSDARALGEMIGLLARRQIRLWTDWRPWLAVAGLVIPLGMLLSIVSRQWAHVNAIYAWLYVNNWTWSYVESPGARRDLLQISGTFLLECLALVCWAWTIGFTLGSLARRTIWTTGVLFAAVLFAGTIGSSTTGLRNPANRVVFSLIFYRDGLPALMRTFLVLMPAVCGMRTGTREATLPMRSALTAAVAVMLLTMWTARSVEGSLVWGWWSASGEGPALALRLRGSWQLRLLPMLMMWPVVYLLASAAWKKRGGDFAAA